MVLPSRDGVARSFRGVGANDGKSDEPRGVPSGMVSVAGEGSSCDGPIMLMVTIAASVGARCCGPPAADFIFYLVVVGIVGESCSQRHR